MLSGIVQIEQTFQNLLFSLNHNFFFPDYVQVLSFYYENILVRVCRASNEVSGLKGNFRVLEKLDFFGPAQDTGTSGVITFTQCLQSQLFFLNNVT